MRGSYHAGVDLSQRCYLAGAMALCLSLALLLISQDIINM